MYHYTSLRKINCHNLSIRLDINICYHKKEHSKCDICDKTFTQPQSLRTHIRTVHLKHLPHVCTYCDKSFGDRTQLKKHIQRSCSCSAVT